MSELETSPSLRSPGISGHSQAWLYSAKQYPASPLRPLSPQQLDRSSRPESLAHRVTPPAPAQQTAAIGSSAPPATLSAAGGELIENGWMNSP